MDVFPNRGKTLIVECITERDLSVCDRKITDKF